MLIDLYRLIFILLACAQSWTVRKWKDKLLTAHKPYKRVITESELRLFILAVRNYKIWSVWRYKIWETLKVFAFSQLSVRIHQPMGTQFSSTQIYVLKSLLIQFKKALFTGVLFGFSPNPTYMDFHRFRAWKAHTVSLPVFLSTNQCLEYISAGSLFTLKLSRLLNLHYPRFKWAWTLPHSWQTVLFISVLTAQHKLITLHPKFGS